MMYTYLLQKDVSDYSWNVAHLYEHSFCHAFFDHMSQHDIDFGVYGFLNAETFEHTIFIYAGFYNKNIADLFEIFFKVNNIPENFIDKSLSEIGIEDNLTYVVADPIKLREQFRAINQTAWVDVSSLEAGRYFRNRPSIISPLIAKRSSMQYRDIVIYYYIENGTIDENILMLRWSVILDDIIRTHLNNNLACYSIYSSPVYAIKDNTIGRTQIVRFSRSAKIKDIKDKVENIVKTFDIKKNFLYINDHFVEYDNKLTWRDDPIMYYKHTDIITSNSYVASLATIDNLLNLMDKTKISVQSYSQPSFDYLQKRLNK